MTPAIVPKVQRALCGHVQLVYYTTEVTTSDRRTTEHEVPCPFCRVVMLESSIGIALTTQKHRDELRKVSADAVLKIVGQIEGGLSLASEQIGEIQASYDQMIERGLVDNANGAEVAMLEAFEKRLRMAKIDQAKMRRQLKAIRDQIEALKIGNSP